MLLRKIHDLLLVVIFPVVLAYAGAVALPLESLWFNPGTPVVADATVGNSLEIAYDRDIKRDFLGSYYIRIKQATGAGFQVVCNSPRTRPDEEVGLEEKARSRRGPFTKDAVLPSNIDMEWWTDGDCLGPEFEAGTYRMETCWTAHNIWYGLIPPKTICRDSEFVIFEDK